MIRIIMSSQDDSWEEAASEMKAAGCVIIKWLTRGVGIFETDKDFDKASYLIRESCPIFIRHIFPLEYSIANTQTDTALEDIAARMNSSSFSVDRKSTRLNFSH